MSKFLNNFQDNQYKRTQSETEDQNQSQELDTKEESKHEIKQRVRDGSKSSAFDDEVVEIDHNYHSYTYKKIVVVCITIVTSLVLLISLYLLSNQTIAVTLVDLTEKDAVKWLEDEDVNYDIIKSESNEVKAGVVISQTIPAGERIGFGDQQQITVSSGPIMTEVVDLSSLKGKTKQEIEKFVLENAIVNVKYTTEFSTKVKQDKLIRMSFEDDSVTPKNYTRRATVEFVISKGDKANKKDTKVENFVNQQTDAVFTWIEGTGIMLDEKQVASESPEGYIVSQSHEPGDMLGFGDIFTIEVSKGSGTPMPNLIGLTIDGAMSVAEENKISFEAKQKYSKSKAGVIISQSIPAGTGVFEDDMITVTESLGQPFITNMRGSNLGEFDAFINELNSQGANLTYSVKEVKRTAQERELGVESRTIKSTTSQNKFIAVGSHIEVTLYV